MQAMVPAIGSHTLKSTFEPDTETARVVVEVHREGKVRLGSDKARTFVHGHFEVVMLLLLLWREAQGDNDE